MQEDSTQNYKDEVSLKDVILFFYNGAIPIIGFTSLFAIAAIIYALYTPVVYEDKLIVTHLDIEGISKINSFRFHVNNTQDAFKDENVFLTFTHELQSWPEQINAAEKVLQSYPSLLLEPKDLASNTSVKLLNETKHELTVRGPDPEILTSYIDNLVSNANFRTITRLEEVERNSRKRHLNSLFVKRQIELGKEDNQESTTIQEMQMNISIADDLNIKRGYIFQNPAGSIIQEKTTFDDDIETLNVKIDELTEKLDDKSINVSEDNGFLPSIKTPGLELSPDWYIFGGDALRGEIIHLQKFQELNVSKEIAIIDAEISYLNSSVVSFDKDINIVNYYRPGGFPNRAYPARTQIVLTVTLLAFFISIFLVHIKNIFTRQKRTE